MAACEARLETQATQAKEAAITPRGRSATVGVGPNIGGAVTPRTPRLMQAETERAMQSVREMARKQREEERAKVMGMRKRSDREKQEEMDRITARFNETLSATTTAYDRQVQDIEESLEQCRNELSGAERHANEWRTQALDLTEELENLRLDSQRSFDNHEEAYRQKALDQERELVELRGRLADGDRQRDAANARASASDLEVHQLRGTLTKLEEQLTEAQGELLRALNAHGGEVESLLNKRLEEAQRKIQDFERALDSKDHEMKSIQSTLVQARNELRAKTEVKLDPSQFSQFSVFVCFVFVFSNTYPFCSHSQEHMASEEEETRLREKLERLENEFAKQAIAMEELVRAHGGEMETMLNAQINEVTERANSLEVELEACQKAMSKSQREVSALEGNTL